MARTVVRDAPDPVTGDVGTCCGGSIAAPLARPEAEELSMLLKAVADPVRLQLISLIQGAEGQEACVCDLTDAVDMSQPTVSHHLKVLTDAGLLTRERRGTWAWFTLVPSRLEDITRIFSWDRGPGRPPAAG